MLNAGGLENLPQFPSRIDFNLAFYKNSGTVFHMSITPESLLAAGKSNDGKIELLWKRFDSKDTLVRELVLAKFQEEIDLTKRKENLKTQIESMTDSEKAKFFSMLKSVSDKDCTEHGYLFLLFLFIFTFIFCVFIFGLVKLFYLL